MSTLFTSDEKSAIGDFLSNGLNFPVSVDVQDLTMKLWQNIKELPYEMDIDFSMIGSSSVVKITNQKDETILTLSISPNRLRVKLAKDKRSLSREDSMCCVFAVMCISGTCNKIIESFDNNFETQL